MERDWGRGTPAHPGPQVWSGLPRSKRRPGSGTSCNRDDGTTMREEILGDYRYDRPSGNLLEVRNHIGVTRSTRLVVRLCGCAVVRLCGRCAVVRFRDILRAKAGDPERSTCSASGAMGHSRRRTQAHHSVAEAAPRGMCSRAVAAVAAERARRVAENDERRAGRRSGRPRGTSDGSVEGMQTAINGEF